MERYLVEIKTESQEEFYGESEDEVRREVEDLLEQIPFGVSYEIIITLMQVA